MRKRKIEVTDYELRHGAPRSSTFCPITLALWTILPGHLEILEDGTLHVFSLRWEMAFLSSGNVRVRKGVPGRLLAAIMLPQEAVLWLKEYDQTGKGKPFSFEMDIPDIQIGDAYEDSQGSGESRGIPEI